MSPKPASNLVFELVEKTQESGKSVFVRTSYDNLYLDFCKLQQDGLPTTQKFDCSLERFNYIIDTMVVKDFDLMCTGPVVPQEAQITASPIISFDGFTYLTYFGLFIAAVYLIVKYCNYRKSKEGMFVKNELERMLHVESAHN